MSSDNPAFCFSFLRAAGSSLANFSLETLPFLLPSLLALVLIPSESKSDIKPSLIEGLESCLGPSVISGLTEDPCLGDSLSPISLSAGLLAEASFISSSGFIPSPLLVLRSLDLAFFLTFLSLDTSASSSEPSCMIMSPSFSFATVFSSV